MLSACAIIQNRGEHGTGRMVTAHAVNAAAGRCRRGTNEHAFRRHCIRGQSKGWPSNDLSQVLNAAANIAADVIGIVFFEIRRRHDMSMQDAITESGRETLDLRLDAISHVDLRIARHMTVSPSRMLAGRCASLIEQARLREDNERAFRTSSLRHIVFAFDNLLSWSTDVDGRSFEAVARFPRNWRAQRPIYLEHSRAISILLQFPAVARR